VPKPIAERAFKILDERLADTTRLFATKHGPGP
jgi:hypothetical protein